MEKNVKLYFQWMTDFAEFDPIICCVAHNRERLREINRTFLEIFSAFYGVEVMSAFYG
jgi:hypothetical protein